MHETHLLKNIFHYLDNEEKLSSRKISKIYLSLSELGGLKAEHFKECYKKASYGTKWESLEIEIKKIPFGPELEITKLDFD
jgi:Zn finger protein HypA/HybF involved in hydrogenase expression